MDWISVLGWVLRIAFVGCIWWVWSIRGNGGVPGRADQVSRRTWNSPSARLIRSISYVILAILVVLVVLSLGWLAVAMWLTLRHLR